MFIESAVGNMVADCMQAFSRHPASLGYGPGLGSTNDMYEWLMLFMSL